MAKKLIDILSAAAVVRDETNEKANTAERVGGVLVELANYLSNYAPVSNVTVEADGANVRLVLHIKNEDGTVSTRSVNLPAASTSEAGVLTPELLKALQAADKSNEDLAKEGISKAESASAMLFAEEAARKEADLGLNDLIEAEVTERLQSVTTEAAARKTADEELSERITSEAASREASDEELSEQLIEELQYRVAADASEAAARESADEELTTRISAEESLRAERDEKLRMMGLVTVRNIERLIQLLSPTSMTVEAPKSITITNPERQRIVAKVDGYGQAMPDTYFLNAEWKDVDYISYFRNLANVIFQSDNRAVFVMTDGTIVPLAVGRSLVNIVPTRNTDLAQTVTIYVHEPYLSKVSASSLKLTGSGALRFL